MRWKLRCYPKVCANIGTWNVASSYLRMCVCMCECVKSILYTFSHRILWQDLIFIIIPSNKPSNVASVGMCQDDGAAVQRSNTERIESYGAKL